MAKQYDSHQHRNLWERERKIQGDKVRTTSRSSPGMALRQSNPSRSHRRSPTSRLPRTGSEAGPNSGPHLHDQQSVSTTQRGRPAGTTLPLRTSDLRDVLLRDERAVVVLHGALQRAVRGHVRAEGPLVGRVRVRLEERRADEGLEHEESAEVHAEDAVRAPVPGRVERRRPAVRPRGRVEGVLGIVDPCGEARGRLNGLVMQRMRRQSDRAARIMGGFGTEGGAGHE